MATSSWFCRQCHSLLPTPDTDSIECRLCGTRSSWADTDPALLTRRTLSAPRQEPAWLVAMRKDKAGKPEALATVDEVCPKCAHGEARFYTMQLRSVDEGQTVFYECARCKHQWNQDN